MDNKVGILLKTSFANNFKFSKMPLKKKIAYFVLVLYVFFGCMVTLNMLFKSMFVTLQENNMTNYYMVLLFSVASLFSFLFTIFSAKSGLFENKDNDLLFSLPVKRSTVLLSRVLYLFLYNLLLGTVFLASGFAIYIINVQVNLVFYLTMLINIVFFPIIPTVLASLFGYLIASLVSKTKRKSMYELLYYTLFIFVYMYFFYSANSILQKLISNVAVLEKMLQTIFFPTYLLSKSIETNNVFYALGFAVINIAVLYLFILVLKKSYLKILSRLNTEQTTGTFKINTLTEVSKKKALYIKEIKKYFSSAIYVFNTLFGVIFLVIAALASLFYSPQALVSFLELGDGISSFGLVSIITMFIIAMTVTTNSSISIERNCFWILKMLPIKPTQVFEAKIFVNKIILLPAVILCMIIFTMTGYITFLEAIFLIVLSAFFNLYVANFGLIANLLFPKLDALNDTVIVKQSMASLVGIFGGLVIAIIYIILLGSGFSESLSVFIMISFVIILYLITEFVLHTWGVKKYNRIG